MQPLLPSCGTPRVRKNNGAGNFRKNAKSRLEDQVMMWATANAHDGRRPGHEQGSKQNRNLKREAENWSTISARDYRSEKASKETMSRNSRSLSEQMGFWNDTMRRQETTGTLGSALQEKLPKDCPRLNATFVEWLMGWPIGHTGFAQLETGAILYVQRLRSLVYSRICGKG